MPSAEVQFEELKIPECDYPPAPYRFKGVGIALVYEIPFARMENVIPSIYKPDPGKNKIWLKVNVYDWREFYSMAVPDQKVSYYESCYKFSIKYGPDIGDYPIKLYLDHDIPIVSGIELYGLPKFRADLKFDWVDSRVRAVIKRGEQVELDIEMEKAKGLVARIITKFANAGTGSYLSKYVGNIIYQKAGDSERMLYTPTHISKIKYELARPSRIFLRELLEWKILTEMEMSKPKYSFLLTSIEAELGEPKSVPL